MQQRQGVARSRLSTTGFSILGLLALRPWSAYELTQQIHRSLRYLWPASERNLYAEPKRLAAAGLVRMRREAVGRRSRTVYEITPAGREALRRHLATPPAPPQLEFEALQRLFYADQGSKQDLLAALDATSRQVEQLLHDGLQQVRGYQTDGGPFPQRLHLIMLFTRFYADFLLLVRDWVARARRRREGRHRRLAQQALRGGRRGSTGQPASISGADRARPRGKFNQAAELDDRARPGYPPSLSDELTRVAAVGPGCRVLEIGCRTGQATVPLAERAAESSRSSSARSGRRSPSQPGPLPRGRGGRDRVRGMAAAARAVRWSSRRRRGTG